MSLLEETPRSQPQRVPSAVSGQSMDPALLATVDQLVLNLATDAASPVARPWSNLAESGEDDEWTTFVFDEEDESPGGESEAARKGERIVDRSPVDASPTRSPYKDSIRPSSLSFKERLRLARPAPNLSALDWSRLVAVESTEALQSEASDVAAGGACVEINSGGQVFFGLLAAPHPGAAEEAVAIKFCNSRHMLQSEQMSAELAWLLEVHAPSSRLLLKVHDTEEWHSLSSCSAPFCSELSEIMGRKQSMMLLQFIPGLDLRNETEAFSPEKLGQTARDLGRLLVLDVMLGNTDRLPVEAMQWRGNPSNVLFSSNDSGDPGRVVPIDAVVARRPPRMLVQETDNKAACLLELVLLDRPSCQEALLDVLSCNAAAVEAAKADWAPTEAEWATRGGRPEGERSAVNNFNAGVREALDLVLSIQGLLEMIVDVVGSWLDNFRSDMLEVSKARALSNTGFIKDMDKQASKSLVVKERLDSWQELLQQKSINLAQAAKEWSERHVDGATHLTFRGFLGLSVINPVADAYELLVRLRHLVARARVMREASNGVRPSDLAPHPLLVGPANSAWCLHLLRKMGVTAIVNCTEEIVEPSEKALQGIAWHRLSIKDVEDQDLGAALEEGLKFIDEAKTSGGRVLVHCHEGISRSVSLCLAYFMLRERWPLNKALDFVRSRRKQARPNAGFMRQLSDLEEKTLGSRSISSSDMPKGKPKMLTCSICGQSVGLSEASLATHMKSKHPESAEA